MKQEKIIILIVLDTVRPDYLSCYNSQGGPTPNIDKLANDSMCYRKAYSCSPWTLPSHASLFTGTYVSTHKTDSSSKFLNTKLPTIASVLLEEDYQTSGISNNMWISRKAGFNRGFINFWHAWEILQRDRHSGYINEALRKLYLKMIYKKLTFGTERIIRKAQTELVRLHRSKPFMMFINFMEAHLPYCPPDRILQQILPTHTSLSEIKDVNLDAFKYMTGLIPMGEDDFEKLKVLYQAEINYLDLCLGRLFDFMKKLKIYDKSMIIVLSDHGENLGEHKLLDHQFCLYETLLKIPLIIKYPYQEIRGESLRQVQNIDIFPTIVDYLNLNDRICSKHLQGISLKDEEVLEKRKYIYAEYYEINPGREALLSINPTFDVESIEEGLIAIIADEWKYIKHEKNRDELFFIPSDPLELNNLADENSKIFWEREIAKMPKLNICSSGINYDFDSDTLKSLKALGYI